MNFRSIHPLFYSLSSLLSLQFLFFSMHFLSLFLLQVITCFFFSSSLKHQVTHIRPNIITYTKPQRTKFKPDFFEKRISQLLEKLCNKLLHKIFKISPIWFLSSSNCLKLAEKITGKKDKKTNCSFFLETHSFQISYRFKKKAN